MLLPDTVTFFETYRRVSRNAIIFACYILIRKFCSMSRATRTGIDPHAGLSNS